MKLSLLLQGILIGFSIAAPVGPIGVLCVRRTVMFGRWAGLVSGLGAATADALYGSIAVFGVTFLSGFLTEQNNWLGILGGFYLCYLGGKIIYETKDKKLYLSSQMNHFNNNVTFFSNRTRLVGNYASTFFLTLTNPITIFSFAAIYAGLGYTITSEDTFTGLSLVLGVFIGSAIWWMLLSTLTSFLRDKFMSIGGQCWIDRISGLILIGFGLLVLVSVFS
jgi:threonine/homoserine/homoserine lactone efflux protein